MRKFWQENTQCSFAFEKLTRPALPTNDGTYIVTSRIPNESTSPTLHNGTHSLDVCSTERLRKLFPSSVGFESIKSQRRRIREYKRREPKTSSFNRYPTHTCPLPQMSSSPKASSSSRGSSSSSSRSATHLHKGSACLNCRRRKIVK